MGTTKTKATAGKKEWNTFIISIALLVVALIILIVSTIFASYRDSPPSPAESSEYTGSITVLDKTESPDHCVFMYTMDADSTGEKRINQSEPLCEMVSIGPAYMEDGYLDYKSLVTALEAQG